MRIRERIKKHVSPANFPGGRTAVLLFGASALLLLGSVVGSSQAALTYYSADYQAEIELTEIGVTLLENGTPAGGQGENGGRLLTNLTGDNKGGTIQPGKPYKEELSVHNSGSIDEYVRVIVYRYWWEAADADQPSGQANLENGGKKRTDLSPELIKLHLKEGSGWVEDKAASTDERTVFYYTKVLQAGTSSSALSDTLMIDSSVLERVKTNVTATNDGKVITLDYDFDGVRFVMEAEVDAVQTHNAQDAIKSAWGVDVTIDESGNLKLTGGSGV